jgi:hypothetical protein
MSDQTLDVVALTQRFNMSASTARRLLRTGAMAGKKVDGKWQTAEEDAENWRSTSGSWLRVRLLNKSVPDVVIPRHLFDDLLLSTRGAGPRRGKKTRHERYEELAKLGFSFLRLDPGTERERYVLLDHLHWLDIEPEPVGPGPIAEILAQLEPVGSA